ncbi:MAG: succinate dehydrogenase, hydrophobic membrane anchor protein [Pseudomonadota bacterium]
MMKNKDCPVNSNLSFLTHNHGTEHKIAHNVTMILLIPFVLFGFYAFLDLRNSSYIEFIHWISTPMHAVISALFVCLVFKHFAMELQVVLEDYISTICLRNYAIIGMKIGFFLVGLLAIVSIAKAIIDTSV